MKIFNKENGIEKVYVQVEDITTFTKIGYPIPASIYKKAMECRTNPAYSRFDFIEYSSEEELEFFRNFEWIVDYKELRNKTEAEMRALAKSDNDEANDIADLWNTLSPEEKKMNAPVVDRYSLLHHRIKSYGQILWNKQNNIHLNFPLVADSDGFGITSPDGQFIIQSGLDSRTLLLSKTNLTPLNERDAIDIDFIDRAIWLAAEKNHSTNEFFGTFHTSRRASHDRQYLVIELVNDVYHEDLAQQKRLGN